MSDLDGEDIIEQAFDEDPELNEQGELDDPPDEKSEDEINAEAKGWVSKEEFKGDPDDWNSAKRFLRTRDIVEDNKALRAKTDRMESDFNRRIENLQKLHDQQLEIKTSDLKDKRDLAASEADMEAYDKANKDLDALETKPIQPTKQQVLEGVVNHPATQQFLVENPWIKIQDEKGSYGQKVLSQWIESNYNNPNAMIEHGLAHTKREVDLKFAAQNKNSMSDSSTGRRRASKNHGLSMENLSVEEKNIWDTMGKTWKNQKDFLQSVADMRKGE